jgi:hypothetical protein
MLKNKNKPKSTIMVCLIGTGVLIGILAGIMMINEMR